MLRTPARGYQEMRPNKIPEPPLNPYMRFSRKFWQKARQENPDRPLWDISRIVGQMWKDLNEAERNEYQQQYEHEKVEYEKVMKMISSSYNANQAAINKKAQKQAVGGNNRRQEPNPGVVIQPVIDEDLYEITPKRLAAIRFERNQRLCLELFNGQPIGDVRSFIGPNRLEQLRKQAENLETSKKSIMDQMAKAEETFIRRKRTIQEESEKFEVELKKACDLRPKVDEDLYNSMVEEASKKLLEQWEAYQKRQEVLKKQNEAEQQKNPILYSLTISPEPGNKDDETSDVATNKERDEEAMETSQNDDDDNNELAADEKVEEKSETTDNPPVENNGNEATIEETPMETNEPEASAEVNPDENNTTTVAEA